MQIPKNGSQAGHGRGAGAIQRSVGFLDKLAYALPTRRVLGPDVSWISEFRERVRSAISVGKCAPFFGSTGRFRYGVHLLAPSGCKLLINFGVRDSKRQPFGLRIECNPAALSLEDIAFVHRFFSEAFPSDYLALLRGARIRRVDIAVDLLRVNLDDLLVTYSHAQNLTMFGKRVSGVKGRVETLTFGSVTSSSAAAVYSKDVEAIQKLMNGASTPSREADRLSDNAVRQLVAANAYPIVRVEVRLRKQVLSPADLGALENRLLRFRFVEVKHTSLIPPLTAKAFRSMCRDMGVKAALRAFKGHSCYSQLRDLLRRRPQWWDPEASWQEALSCRVLKELLAPSATRAHEIVAN